MKHHDVPSSAFDARWILVLLNVPEVGEAGIHATAWPEIAPSASATQGAPLGLRSASPVAAGVLLTRLR